MTEKYIMARHSAGNIIYTFEFIMVLIFFIIVFYFWKVKDDKNSFFVYLICGIGDSLIELFANISGVRTIEETFLFGVLNVGFPLLQLIMGFYEGAIQCLVAYHLIKAVMIKDKLSLKFALSYLIITNAFIALGQILKVQGGAPSVGITRREIFSSGSIILLITCFLVSFGYFFLNPSIRKDEKKSFLLWYLFIIVVYFPIFLINHITMNRFIEIQRDDVYVIAPLLDQIIVLYGYGLGIEAAGFFLPFFIIIHRLKLINFDD